MASDELAYLSAIELTAAIRAKKLSPVEVTRAVLDRIERIDPLLNSYTSVMADEALEAARLAEQAVMRGESLGALHGVPVSVKDIMPVRNSRTTFGSKLFEHNVATEDAPVIERLRSAGAIIIGRTNSPEFGWKGVTDNRVFGITRNPWNTRLTPGGSSGGASAAVSAGLGPIGIGTDGGGSLRIPASFTSLVGYKASFGRVPNYPASGVDSLRHTGPLTRNVADAALVLNAIAGPDERDPNSLPKHNVEYLASLDRDIKGLRIAYSPDLGYAEVDQEVADVCRKAALRLAEAGATVEPVELKWPDPYDIWTTFFYGGIAARVADAFAEKGDLLDPGLRPVVERGLQLSAVDYVNALVKRNQFWQTARRIFETHDLLVTPTLAVTAFPVGQDKPLGQDGAELRWSPFTYPFNLTGQPAVSVPCGFSKSELPIGLQIVGRRFADETVLRAARTWEQIFPWAHRQPKF